MDGRLSRTHAVLSRAIPGGWEVEWPAQKFGGGQKICGGKMLDFWRITLFCLEKRLSKHKIAIFSKN